jgi:hypothetical protein
MGLNRTTVLQRFTIAEAARRRPSLAPGHWLPLWGLMTSLLWAVWGERSAPCWVPWAVAKARS